ncbi:uncharacterized protein METZ01_LOCUS464816, partial [marine metagenome]
MRPVNFAALPDNCLVPIRADVHAIPSLLLGH